MSLQDQHLQQALKNAPDRDMVPNAATRAAVLTYANKEIEKSQNTWLKRTSNLLREWLGASWHMAGVGSAVATVLVVVVFWHELPDDTMRKVATPSEETEISATDSPIASVPEATHIEKSFDRASSGAAAPAQESSAKMVENKTAIDVPPSKAKSANLASFSNRETVTSADQPVLKNNGLAEAIPQAAVPVAIESEIPAVVAPAPAPLIQDKSVVASAPAANASTNDVVSTTSKGELAKELQAESDASLRAPNENIMAKKPSSKVDALGASAPKAATKPKENQVLLARIKNEGGKVAANQDIQAGNLRLLKIETQSKDLDMLNCTQLTAQAMAVDVLTGYKIESVGSCDATASLLKEVEVYNQVMRDWYSNHLR